MGSEQEVVGAHIIINAQGVLFIDAVDICKSYEVDPHAKQHVFDAWQNMLETNQLHPGEEPRSESVWIPLVLVVAFLRSVEADLDAQAQYAQLGVLFITAMKLRSPVAVSYLSEQYSLMLKKIPDACALSAGWANGPDEAD